MKLKDKVAIVTGSSKGIGKGIASVFSGEGAKVVISSRNEAEGIKVAKELGSDEGRAIYVKADVSNIESIQNLIETTIKTFGKLDVLVNNAGFHLTKPAEAVTVDEWDKVIDTNLRGTFFCIQYALPHLKSTEGSIINISSIEALMGAVNGIPYVASKGGQIAMTKSMACEFAPYKVRVNCICPGVIDTPDAQNWFRDMGGKEDFLPQINAMIPLGHIGTIQQIGNGALYLASDDASYVTGTTLTIDGGITRH